MADNKKPAGGKIDEMHGGRQIAHDSALPKKAPLTVSYDKPIPPENPKKD